MSVKVSVADTADTALAKATLTTAFDRLSEDHRQVLRKLHFNGVPVKEIARRLQIPVGTVKSRAHSAMQFRRDAVISPDR